MSRTLRHLVPAAIALALIVGVILWQRSPGGPGEQPSAEGAAQTLSTGSATARAAPGKAERTDWSRPERLGSLRLEGLVLDETDRPVPGAVVTIDTDPPTNVTAEGDGSFSFTKLMERVYSVEASAGNRVAGPTLTRVSAEVEPVVLRLRAGSALRIAVSDDSGAPVANAAIELRSTRVFEATTQREGLAQIEGLNPDLYTMRVTAPGLGTSVREVEVPSGGVVEVEVVLLPGVTVSGSVRDLHGAPVAGASVGLRPTSDIAAFAMPYAASTTTALDGTWSLSEVPVGVASLDASHPQRTTATQSIIVSSTGARDVRIVLGDTARVRGVVTRPDGTPVSGAEVRASLATTDLLNARPRWATTTANDGRFEIVGVPRAQLAVVATTASSSSATVRVDLGAQPEVTLSLSLVPDLAIEGTTIDERGSVLAEVQVVGEPVDQGPGAALRDPVADVSDSTGHFRLRALAAGAYRLRASPPGSVQHGARFASRAPKVVEAGTADVRLVVPRDGVVIGRLVDRSGAAVTSFSLTLDAGAQEHVESADGAFSLDEVPAGDHTVAIRGDSFVPVTRRAITRPGTSTDLGIIQVDVGRRITGFVRDSAGAPVRGARVSAAEHLLAGAGGDLALLDSITDARTARSDASGHFVLDNVSAVSVVVMATHPVLGRSPAQRVSADRRDPIELILDGTGSLHGRLFLAEHPVGGAQVLASSAAGASVTTQSADDGSYNFDRLAPGLYAVTASEPGSGFLAMGSMTVVASQSASLDLSVTRGELVVRVRIGAGASSARGHVVAARIEQSPDGTSHVGEPLMAEVGADRVATLEGARAGRYRFCFAAAAVDGVKVRPICQDYDVAAAPQTQEFELVIGASH